MKNKKRIFKIIIAWLILIGLVFGLVGCNNSKKDNIDNKANKATGTNEQLEPNSIMINHKYTDKKITNAESAIDSLNEVADVLGITNVNEEFELKSEENFMGDIDYRLAQIYKGISVYGRDISVHVDENGDVFGLSSNYLSVYDKVSVVPKYSKEDAKNGATEYLIKDFGSKKGNINIGEALLIIDTMVSPIPTLTYIVEVAGTKENDAFYMLKLYIDANTNKVYHAENRISFSAEVNDVEGQREGIKRPFYADVQGDIITMTNAQYVNDIGSEITIFTPKLLNPYDWYIDGNSDIVSWKKGVEGKTEKSAVDAMVNVSNTLKYFYDVLKRKSYDDNGKDVNIYVNVTAIGAGDVIKEDISDAFHTSYNGKQIIAFKVKDDGSDQSSVDLITVAHEFTHGVIAETSSFSFSFLESHTLNEAYSYILGLLINEYYSNSIDWNIEGALNFKNPHNSGNGEFPKNTSEYNGDPSHDREYFNSTIIGHAAYLMWNGGINGEWARIKDTKLLAKLWYGSLKFLKSNSNFSDCRNAVIVSATKLYAKEVITEEQLETVAKAFEEVGLGVKTTNIHYGFHAKEEFNLNIYNLIKKPHSNYHLKIEHRKAKYVPGEVIVDEDVKTDSKSLTLKNHSDNMIPEIYLLTITNLENPNQQESVYITVKNGGFSSTDKVNIYTNFSPNINPTEKNSTDTIPTIKAGDKISFTGIIETYVDARSGEEYDAFFVKLSSPFSYYWEDGKDLITTDTIFIFDSKDEWKKYAGKEVTVSGYAVYDRYYDLSIGESITFESNDLQSSKPSEKVDKQNDLQSSESSKKVESEIVSKPESEIKKPIKPEIPQDAVIFNGHSYKVFKNGMNWSQAKEYCESLGGHLATVTSKGENDFLNTYIRSSGHKGAYFGLTDEAVEGAWAWVTGEPVTYFNWALDEPNNQFGREHYVIFSIYETTGVWNDIPHEVWPFICEWDSNT